MLLSMVMIRTYGYKLFFYLVVLKSFAVKVDSGRGICSQLFVWCNEDIIFLSWFPVGEVTLLSVWLVSMFPAVEASDSLFLVG